MLHSKTEISAYLTVLTDYAVNNTDSEELWVQLIVPGWRKQAVDLVYRPPSGKVKVFSDRLEQTLHRLHARYQCNQPEYTF